MDVYNRGREANINLQLSMPKDTFCPCKGLINSLCLLNSHLSAIMFTYVHVVHITCCIALYVFISTIEIYKFKYNVSVILYTWVSPDSEIMVSLFLCVINRLMYIHNQLLLYDITLHHKHACMYKAKLHMHHKAGVCVYYDKSMLIYTGDDTV